MIEFRNVRTLLTKTPPADSVLEIGHPIFRRYLDRELELKTWGYEEQMENLGRKACT